VEQLDSALNALAGLGESSGKVRRPQNVRQEAESYVSGGAQTNCSISARTLGEVETSQAKQIKTTPVSVTADDASDSSEGVARGS
jgi:hypothetical protein